MDSRDCLLRSWLVLLLFLIASPGWAQNAGDFWQPTEGPLGGDIHLFAADASRDTLLASDGESLFQYDGTTWRRLDAPGDAFTALHVTPSGTYFLAVSRPDPESQHARLGSILRSDDGGLTWTPAGLNDLDGTFAFITLSPAEVLFAGGSLGLYRMDEDGATWMNVTPTGGHGGLVADHLSFAPDGSLFTVSNGLSVHRSENGGETWTVQHAYVTDTGVGSLAIDDDGVLFAGMSNMGDRYYLERSTDDGQTWQRLDASSFPIAALFAREEALLAGTLGGGVLQSLDQGETWEQLDLPARYVRTLATGPEGLLFAGTSLGVYTSTDGGTSWTFLGEGMRTHTTSLLPLTDGSLLAGTLGGGLFRSTDGLAWDRLDLPSIYVRTLLETNTVLLVGTQRMNEYAPEGAFYSADDGETWERGTFTTVPHPISPDPITFTTTTVLDFLAHPDGTLYAAANDNSFTLVLGVYRSVDGGQTWTQTLLRNDNDDPIGATSLTLGLNDTVLATTREGVYALDEDDSWTLRTDEFAHTLLAQPNGNILIGGFDGLYRLAPGSTTASPLALDGHTIHDLHANADGDLFAATNLGVFRSNNGGISWQNVSDNLGDVPVLALALDAEETLFAGTDGVYRTTPTFIITTTDETAEVPTHAVLSQNYPNPFNLETTIRYQLAQPGPVRLVVFDVLGREVATLIETIQPVGTHEAVLDATPLPNGVYLYRLETADRHLSRTMLLAK